MTDESGTCECCGEPFSDGDGGECPVCKRTLCYVCLGYRYADMPGAHPVCVRCVKKHKIATTPKAEA